MVEARLRNLENTRGIALTAGSIPLRR